MTTQTHQWGRVGGILIVLGLAALPARGADQASEQGAVTGTGVVILKRQPEALRMKVELSTKGKTLQEAIATLNARRDAAEAKLPGLRADKKSLVRGEPRVAAAQTDRQRQVEMMVRSR